MKLVDPNDPFYRPRWRRIAIVAVCAGWFLFEILSGMRDPFFTPIAGGLFAYSLWVFILNWKEPPPSA